MNYEKNITQLESKIKQDKSKLTEYKRLRDEERKAEAKKNRKPPGRKPLDAELIERAKELAKTKTLPDVALRLGIALRSLYNNGISRKSINAEIAIKPLKTTHK